MSDNEAPLYIGIEKITEHDNGDATYTFLMSDKASENIKELGLKLILFCGATQTDLQDVFDWIMSDKIGNEDRQEEDP